MGIIIKPLVTEKMTAITDKLNRFGFVVRPDANKLEIKKEVEALYNCLLYTSPSPRDPKTSRMPSSA